MKILVTAGNTAVPIDRVRQITNVFTGRTGAAIARHAHARGHEVTLLTSHPDAVSGLPPDGDPRFRLLPYRTFAELMAAMETAIRTGGSGPGGAPPHSAPPDAVIHSAAVSDFVVAGVYAPVAGTRVDRPTTHDQRPTTGVAKPAADLTWVTEDGSPPRMVDVAAGKVKSDAPEVWLRLARAPKIIDRIREEWGFGGVLVKFKLEVAVAEARLLEIAEASRRHSRADLMVANTLETAHAYAYLGPFPEGYRRIPRGELPEQLLNAVTALAEPAA